LFKVNTGCRKQEVLQLRWNWEVQVSGTGNQCVRACRDNDEFQTKNSQERIVVLNSIARRVVDANNGASIRSSCSRIAAGRRGAS
jgi:hypothetical protein